MAMLSQTMNRMCWTGMVSRNFLVGLLLLSGVALGRPRESRTHDEWAPEPADQEMISEGMPFDGAEGLEEFSLFQKGQVLGKLPGFAVEKEPAIRSFPRIVDLHVPFGTVVDVLFGMVVCALVLHLFQGSGGDKKKSNTQPQAGKMARPRAAFHKENIKDQPAKTSELHAMVAFENLQACEELLVKGADVNRGDAWFCTPLHIAARLGSVSGAKLLLAHKANPNAVEAWDQTPLHLAAAAGHQEVCSLLLENHADVNPVDAQDRTPLLLAGQNGRLEVADFLLKKDAVVGKSVGEERIPSLLSTLMLRNMLDAGHAEKKDD